MSRRDKPKNNLGGKNAARWVYAVEDLPIEPAIAEKACENAGSSVFQI
jgi:hypothetical protein